MFEQVTADHEDGAFGVVGDEVGDGAEEEAAHAPFVGGANDDQVGIALIEEGHEAVGEALVGHDVALGLFMAANVRPCCTLERLTLRFDVDVGLDNAQDVDLRPGGLADACGELQAELSVRATAPRDQNGAYFV